MDSVDQAALLGNMAVDPFDRIQHEGEVVHLVAQRPFDFSGDVVSLGERAGEFPFTHGRAEQVKHGAGADPRETPKTAMPVRDFYIPDLHIDTLKVKSQNLH